MVETVYLMIGLAMIFGFALVLSYLTKVNIIKGIVGYGLVVCPFVYKGGLIDLWIIIVFLFLNLILVMSELKRGRAN